MSCVLLLLSSSNPANPTQISVSLSSRFRGTLTNLKDLCTHMDIFSQGNEKKTCAILKVCTVIRTGDCTQ